MCVEVVQHKFMVRKIATDVLRNMMAYACKHVQGRGLKVFMTFFLSQGGFLELCRLADPWGRNLPGRERDPTEVWHRCARLLNPNAAVRGVGGHLHLDTRTTICEGMISLAVRATGVLNDHSYVNGRALKFRAGYPKGSKLKFVLEEGVDVKFALEAAVNPPVLLRSGTSAVVPKGPPSDKYVPPRIFLIQTDPRMTHCNATVHVEATRENERGKQMLLVCVEMTRQVKKGDVITSKSQRVPDPI